MNKFFDEKVPEWVMAWFVGMGIVLAIAGVCLILLGLIAMIVTGHYALLAGFILFLVMSFVIGVGSYAV